MLYPVPKKCDLCHEPFTTESKIYDAKTTQGPWGFMCEKCFKDYGIGLGTGRGQCYTHINGKWVKIAG